jgi:hypothetical protein
MFGEEDDVPGLQRLNSSSKNAVFFVICKVSICALSRSVVSVRNLSILATYLYTNYQRVSEYTKISELHAGN